MTPEERRARGGCQPPAVRDGRTAPAFLVGALRDPIGANLDRIQIVKGWLDGSGARQEKVYDVAWSGDRKPGADGTLPAVGSDGRQERAYTSPIWYAPAAS
jgi:hypothetical protein